MVWEEFTDQIAAALAASDAEHAECRRQEEQLLTHYTWNSIADRMMQLIADSYQSKIAAKRSPIPVSATPVLAGSQP